MKLFLFFLCAIGLTLASCSDDTTTGPEPETLPVIKNVRAPDFIALNESCKIEVQVSDPQGARDLHQVILKVFGADPSKPVLSDTLRDDGGYLDPGDNDAVAGDGTFTNMITLPTTITKGELRFIFQAFDKAGNASQTFEKKIITELNAPPQILSVMAPDFLPSGFKSEILQVAVADSNGADDIYSVIAWVWSKNLDRLRLYDDGSHGDKIPSDLIYSLAIDSSFTARSRGITEVKFAAMDKYNSWSSTTIKTIDMENKPPRLFNLSVPDSVRRPTTSKNAFLMQVSAIDPQSLADIKRVGLVTIDPKGSYGTVATPENPLPLVDNGDLTLGDVVAGDGIYSLGASIASNNELGVWTFIFQAEDWVGNKSDSLVQKITVFE